MAILILLTLSFKGSLRIFEKTYLLYFFFALNFIFNLLSKSE